MIEPADGPPLTAALPGQFVAVRLRPSPDAPALIRSYSLSGEPSAERYRVSVKREAHGAASTYIDEKLQVGDVVDASAAGGAFTLRPGDAPVVLLSAGIGRPPCSQCSTRWRPRHRRGKSGGYMAPRDFFCTLVGKAQ